MEKRTVGISDIALYIPSPKIAIETILSERMKADPDFGQRLRRAVDLTGQKAIRFPDVFEDNVTIAANSAKRLIDMNGQNDLANLRYLAVGTETAVDMSKPISAYVGGMLQRAGYNLPTTISTFQVQHACAGGTLAMLSVAALLQAGPRQNEGGIVICSDIARYDAPSTAEITQGAGSASLLIENNPSLIELDMETQGYSSSDVDDFFRPLGSITAKVKGRYSVQCYYESLDLALRDHAQRSGRELSAIIGGTDMFVFHVPFAQMAINAAKRLLKQHLDLQDLAADAFLNARGFYQALEPSAQVGNIYTGALYLNMVAQLSENYAIHGKNIVGKRMLIASYGSGNTMIVLSARVSEKAPTQLERWNIPAQLNHDRQASWDEYTQWMKFSDNPADIATFIEDTALPNDVFVLEGIREDGYRQYSYRKQGQSWPIQQNHKRQ